MLRKRIDTPIGTKVGESKVYDTETFKPTGDVIEEYEVEILGCKVRYFHTPEYEPTPISWATRKPFDLN